MRGKGKRDRKRERGVLESESRQTTLAEATAAEELVCGEKMRLRYGCAREVARSMQGVQCAMRAVCDAYNVTCVQCARRAVCEACSVRGVQCAVDKKEIII